MKVSVVTVAMNRTEHLLKSAQEVSKLNFHQEHIILDYGSTIPVCRDDLPNDARIKLHRVDSTDGKWWLTHSFNLAFALSQGDYILKLDADTVPSQILADKLLQEFNDTHAHLMCNRLTLQDWSLPSELFTTNGFFFCQRASLEKLGGFNPYIRGWGWDEIDLYSRFFLAGYPVCRIPNDGLRTIEHDDLLREHRLTVHSKKVLTVSKSNFSRLDATRRMQAQNEKNRLIAVASIKKKIVWPTFKEYLASYSTNAILPTIEKVNLFSANDKQYLIDNLIPRLLQPSHLKHRYWILLKRLNIGPYSIAGADSIFETCNIDLSLV